MQMMNSTFTCEVGSVVTQEVSDRDGSITTWNTTTTLEEDGTCLTSSEGVQEMTTSWSTTTTDGGSMSATDMMYLSMDTMTTTDTGEPKRMGQIITFYDNLDGGMDYTLEFDVDVSCDDTEGMSFEFSDMELA
jgi:hypothetical protein